MISLEEFGLSGEPTAAAALASGPTIVTMSGDKLLGGPQAGIILGKATALAKLRKNPFARAMRVDKLTLSALEATLRLYLDPPRALREIPVLAMLTAPVSTIESRARSVAKLLEASGIATAVVSSVASVGGGAFPTATIPSAAVALSDAARQEEALRRGEPAVIGRIADRRLLLDLRSVLPREDGELAQAIIRARA
jgi:L-seryl-tRNA(Ser) seleniumtransferase